MNRAAKIGLVVLGIAAAAAPFWVALTIPFEDFGKPPAVRVQTAPREILVDLRAWDAATPASRRAAAEDVARRLPDFALLRMETFSCGGQTHEVAIYAHAKTGMEFVLVPGGTFVMGWPASEPDRADSEAQQSVTLTHPFLICRTECTQAAFERVEGMKPSHFLGAQLPVESVNWDESGSFCTKAGLELPSTAQWERACRSGTATAWSWGDDAGPLAGFAWCGSPPNEQTHPVAQLKPNSFGLFDMHGNVQEWCADWNPDPDAPFVDSATDPIGPPTGRYREFRPGCWTLGSNESRSASRYWSDPGERRDFTGFRPAKTVPTE